MEHDEHEILVEYSEMTAFNFNSKEYQNVKHDFIECKNWVSKINWYMENFVNLFKPAKNY